MKITLNGLMPISSWQDVNAGKVERHMLNHWEADHPDDKGMHRFKIRVVRTCQDALSRQVGESVRIDLRGGNVLNSRTEYSRCRLPRLTIDKEEWKTAKEKEKKASAEEAATVVDALTEEELAWLTEEESSMATCNGEKQREQSMRKTEDQERRGSKRKKLDLIVDWVEHGEDEEEASSIKKWLTGVGDKCVA